MVSDPLFVSDGSKNHVDSQTKYPIPMKHSDSRDNTVHSDSDMPPEQSGTGGTMHSLCGTLLIGVHPELTITWRDDDAARRNAIHEPSKRVRSSAFASWHLFGA